jgi:hypothetical protein
MTKQTTSMRAEVLDVVGDRELTEEVMAFYRDYLIPELVCGPPGYPDRPNESWLWGEDRDVLGVRDEHDHGRLIGVWALKEHGIYFPCVDVEWGGEPGLVAIFRALAELSIERHGEQLFASTSNQMIIEWATKMELPELVVLENRLEWKP